MRPICLPGVNKDFYYIEEDRRIWSKYLKDYMSPHQDRDGYLHLRLSGGSREQHYDCRVATLVALTYIGEPPVDMIDPTINHIDGNKLNNHYSNLEWVERGVNSSIRENKGAGAKNHEVKLTEEQVIEICELLVSSDLTQRQIATKYNVSPSAISGIKKQTHWQDITKNYDFSNRVMTRNEAGQFTPINLNNRR